MTAPAAAPAWVERLRVEAGEHAPMVLAADRCEFRLTYVDTDPRPMLGNTLDGPDLPDARGGGYQAGEWFDGDSPDTEGCDTVGGWVDFYARMAVAEAVHEALEWFRVDGAPWLDPHGAHEKAIHAATRRFVDELAGFRAEAVAS